MASEPKPPEGRRWLTGEAVRFGDWAHPVTDPSFHWAARFPVHSNWNDRFLYSRAIEPEAKPSSWTCTCSPGIPGAADEDGCCTSCGADAVESPCPHCAAKDLEIDRLAGQLAAAQNAMDGQSKLAGAALTENSRLKEEIATLEEYAKAWEQAPIAADFNKAIQQARREVLEMACKIACLACRRLVLNASGRHVVNEYGLTCSCAASPLRAAFDAKWLEAGSGEKEAKHERKS